MGAATVERELIRDVGSGDWTVRATFVAQILIAVVAVVGVAAWATLRPIFILTFLFLEPLLVVGMILFVVAAFFSEKSLLSEKFKAGATVIRQGSPAEYMYVVRTGELHGEGRDGDFHYEQDFKPGECFGMTAMVAKQVYRLTVTARTDAVLYRIDPADLPSVIANAPYIEKSLEGILDTRLGDLVGRDPQRRV
jgi:Cyclic nucleotide-binding domain